MTATQAYIEVTDATFASEVLERSKSVPVVVDFWAPWCRPCRVLGPVIEKIASELGEQVVLAKLNTDENPRVATQYRIQGIPAVKAFKNAQLIGEFTGAYPEPQVRNFFEQVVGFEAPPPLSPGDEMLERGDMQGAEAYYRGVLEKQKDDADALIGLAIVLLERGDRDEAEELLDRIPTDRRAKALRHHMFLEEFARKHGEEDLQGDAERNPKDPRARYRWGVMLAAHEQWEAALEELLESVRLDKGFAEGAARKAVLAVFDILGLDSPFVKEYQRRLSSLLF
ncbi:MAG TPA: tetratricopeptide repeat protein [Tepidiformaceae bacterium]|nr:tetratricopeptide repeat protein [Tepidiformaceae bacterium]